MSKTGYSAKIKSGHFRHLEQYPLSDRERYCTSRTLKDAPLRESKTEAGNCPGRHRKPHFSDLEENMMLPVFPESVLLLMP